MPGVAGALWEAGPPITLSDRGFAYADGVFETILLRNGTYWLLSRHLQRLHKGLRELQLALPQAAMIEALLAEAAHAAARAGADTGVLKLFASAAPAARGYGRPAGHPVVLRAQLWRSTADPARPATDLACAVSPHRLPASAALGSTKHLSRAEQVLAAIRVAGSPEQELLLGSEDGKLQCATSANLVIERKGLLCTPVLQGPTIAGTLREELLDDPTLGLRCAPVSVAELPALTGLWSINSVVGLRRLYLHGTPSRSGGQGELALLAAIGRSLARSDEAPAADARS